MAKNTTEVFIPGKAYEIICAAPFMSGRIWDQPQRDARVSLKNGERRNKGRGYRVLVNLTGDGAQYLCDWLSNFLNSDDYSKLGTAEALAVRTITDRICEIANVCATAREKRQVAVQRRVAAMQAGRERKLAEERQAKAAEDRETLARLESQVPEYIKEYDAVMDKIDRTRDIAKGNRLFDKADNLQRAIINSKAQINVLRERIA